MLKTQKEQLLMKYLRKLLQKLEIIPVMKNLEDLLKAVLLMVMIFLMKNSIQLWLKIFP